MKPDTQASQLEKGNSLENAVRAIETAILSTAPGFAEGTFQIEGKKIISSNGVHHEIDLHVTASVANGYEAIFIFECKNWTAEKVGKNDIIILSEKVKASNAQRGFFVAKSYTKDAVSQAKQDPRIELLTAKELDPSSVMVPITNLTFAGVYSSRISSLATIRPQNENPALGVQCRQH